MNPAQPVLDSVEECPELVIFIKEIVFSKEGIVEFSAGRR